MGTRMTALLAARKSGMRAMGLILLLSSLAGSLPNLRAQDLVKSLSLLPPANLETNPGSTFPAPYLEILAQHWLQNLLTLGSLPEASAGETALFDAISELAAHYGFAIRRYPLDQIKTLHSFSQNLEVLIPAEIQNPAAQAILNRDSLPKELWAKIYQDKREVVILSPISGAAALDLVSLLSVMAQYAQAPPPLPLRVVFLGSELLPKYLQFPQARSYPLGSRSFLYNYSHLQPYGLLYLYHQSQPQIFSHIRFDMQWLKSVIAALRPKNPSPKPSQAGQILSPEILYRGSLIQSPVHEAQQLAQALQQSGLGSHYSTGFQLLTALRGTQGKPRPLLFDPYLEKGLPIIGLYQHSGSLLQPASGASESLPIYARQSSQVAIAVQHWLLQKLEQALTEQYQIAAENLQPGGLQRSGRPGTHYWLWHDIAMISGYLSERQILFGILLAIFLFALCSLCTQRHFLRLQAFQRLYRLDLLLRAALNLLLIASYIVFANEALIFILRLLPLSDPSVYQVAIVLILKISFVLLFLYSSALGLPLGDSQELLMIPYLSQCLSFATIFLLLWWDFSLAPLALFLFFLHSIYYFMPRQPSKNLYLRFANILLIKLLFLVLFLPYLLLLFLVPLPQTSFLQLLSSNYTLLFLLPNFALYLSEVHVWQRHRPKRYRKYLLRHTFFHGSSIVLCLVFLYFHVDKTDPAAPPPLHLEEIYQLEPPEKRIVLRAEDDFPLALGRGLDSVRLLEGGIQGEIEGQQDPVPHSPTSRGQLLLYRELTATEREALLGLGQNLFRSDTFLGQQYFSSTLQLQSATPLRYLLAEVEGQDLLFANFPFSIPRKDQENNIRSKLLIGLYPPKNLQLEFLFHQQPESYRIHYTLDFSVPREQGSLLRLEKSPLAQLFFPQLSQVLWREEGSEYRVLEPGKDFIYIIQVRGLQYRPGLRQNVTGPETVSLKPK